jgi:hypothetical protein
MRGVVLLLGGLGGGLTTPYSKNSKFVTNRITELRTRTDSLARPKYRKMDMRFGTWNVMSLYRIGSLKTVGRELGEYELDSVGVQEVRWGKGGTKRADDYTFFCGQGKGDHQLGKGFFLHKSIVSVVRRVEFISDRMSYMILRGRWCNIIFMNVHAPREDKSDDVKDSFYEEL